MDRPSADTEAILLLTAPLIVGRGAAANPDLLSPGEYRQLAARLRSIGARPADLLPMGAETIAACAPTLDEERARRLLGRGFQLGQAVQRWQARGIWIVSRADAAYPHRLKARLRGAAPTLIYGCGDAALLDAGGLAVVGSRHVDAALTDNAAAAGALAARAGRTIVSGGAKGIDQAAMRGALEAGGSAAGMLADSLARLSVAPEHRDMIADGRLVLASPFDPNAGFNVGHAMQRNKFIYALADAALVVGSDEGRGGTWAGAAEQLDRLRLVPVYVRATGAPSSGLDALRRKGARPWPDPADAEALAALLDAPTPVPAEAAPSLPFSTDQADGPGKPPAPTPPSDAADDLFVHARNLILPLLPMKASAVADVLHLKPVQAEAWLQRLADECAVLKSRNGEYQVAEPRLID